MEEQKQTNKERLREITEGIEQGIKDLFESDKYMQYLRVMSRFHHYSVNNVMLIHMQKPDAAQVAGFNKWRDQFGRHVKRGEKGIKIIAPTPFKKKVEEIKRDPDTKAPILDKDGKAIMEEKEVQIPMFKVVTVFDVSQTEGKPVPQLASDLAGNVQHYEIFMEALHRSSPVPMEMELMDAEMDGYFDPKNQRIAIRPGMSEVQTVSAVIHEITHAKLHNYKEVQQEAAQSNETKEAPKPKDRYTEEVEAESVSYAVCQYYGIQTGENSFGYIASWSKGKELTELRASLETVNKTANGLITDIDRHFAAICKERGIDLTAETPDQALDEYPTPDETLRMADLEACGYMDGDMLPLSRGRAGELHDQGLTVYAIMDGGKAEMLFDREEVEAQAPGTVYAVSREEWEQSPVFHGKIMDRQQHQEEREAAFLDHAGDCCHLSGEP